MSVINYATVLHNSCVASCRPRELKKILDGGQDFCYYAQVLAIMQHELGVMHG